MVRYAAARHSGVPVVERAFPACVLKHWEEFLLTSIGQTWCRKWETLSKSNLDEEPFVQTWTISILKPLFAFLSLIIFPLILDHGLFCSKRNKENGIFLFDISGYKMFLLN